VSRYFASDSFRTGGQLVDQATWYAGRDKVQHAVCGFILATVCRRAGLSQRATLVVVLVAAIAWEVAELLRYLEWERRMHAMTAVDMLAAPWPPFTDQFSWRDIVATMAGALLAVVL